MKPGEHETVNRLLAAYLDKEVSGDERCRVEAHLLTCERCRRDLDSLQRAQEKLRAALRSAAAEADPSTEAWNELELWIGGAQRPSFTRSLANLIVRRKRGRKKPGPGKPIQS
jgi:anti-sigma factor RsiW